MVKFFKKRGKFKLEVFIVLFLDIIFMLFFFFMVVIVLRDVELMVKVFMFYVLELIKLEEKLLVNYLYIGWLMQKYESIYGIKLRLQFGDKFVIIFDILLFLEKYKIKVLEVCYGQIIFFFWVDGEVIMGIVIDVKIQFCKLGQLKVNYFVKKDLNVK